MNRKREVVRLTRLGQEIQVNFDQNENIYIFIFFFEKYFEIIE